MPLFALANAGVSIAAVNFKGSIALATFAGLAFGKPMGVFLFSFVAVRMRWALRPPSLSWGMLASGSLLTGIGFTMALFIGELAFDPGLLNSAKVGIFGASIAAGTSGLLALAWLTRRKAIYTRTSQRLIKNAN